MPRPLNFALLPPHLQYYVFIFILHETFPTYCLYLSHIRSLICEFSLVPDEKT